MNPQQQYILARDTIDMIRGHVDDSNVLEYIDSLCFSVARILEDKSAVDWDALASICDQRYYSLKTGDPVLLDTAQLDTLYSKYSNKI